MKQLISLFLLLTLLHADENNVTQGKFTDSLDGQFDMSNFIASKYGFLPVPIIITGPTFGLGGALNVMFLHDKFTGRKSSTGKYIPPSMSGLVIGATENGTTFGAAYHIGFYMDGDLRTTTFLGRPNANMSFFPSLLGQEYQVKMNLDGWVAYQEIKYRIFDSDFFAGANIMYQDLSTKPTDSNTPPPLSNALTMTHKLGSAAAVVEFDNRNTIFTPTNGLYFKGVLAGYKGSAETFTSLLDNDYSFLNLRCKAFYYTPLSSKAVLGLRAEYQVVDGNAPFYMYPSVQIRGIQNQQYQGQESLVTEAELRYEVINRHSLITFLGTGKAFGSSGDNFGNSDTLISAPLHTSYGFGYRYEIARKFGIHAGFDYAFGPVEDAFYITMGSAWNAFF